MKPLSLLLTAAAYVTGAALAIRHSRREAGQEVSQDDIKTELTSMHRSLVDEAKEKAGDVVSSEKMMALRVEVLGWLDGVEEEIDSVIMELKKHESHGVKKLAARLEKFSEIKSHIVDFLRAKEMATQEVVKEVKKVAKKSVKTLKKA